MENVATLKNCEKKLTTAKSQSIVADHLFFSEVGEGSVERTVLMMLWHVKEANQLIQAKVGLHQYCPIRGDN